MSTKETVRLTGLSHSGGCAAKIGPGTLLDILSGLQLSDAPELLVGMDPGDDAAVYKLSDSLALIQTLDFFPPIVDDPYLFGQIAAANALSDIYAMGGSPILAMNIFAFPCRLGTDVLQAVLRGGAEKVEEAGALVVGGHSLEDKEPKYGLSVCGLTHPEALINNTGASVDDYLVLTKPLGLGILTTALKSGGIHESDASDALTQAARLNKSAAEAMTKVGVNAATDITGFGLAGHLTHLLESSGKAARLDAGALPIWSQARNLAEKHQPGGTRRNQEFLESRVKLASDLAKELAPLIFDPQTSGGLLISAAEKKVEALLFELDEGGASGVVIGRICRYETGARVIVK